MRAQTAGVGAGPDKVVRALHENEGGPVASLRVLDPVVRRLAGRVVSEQDPAVPHRPAFPPLVPFAFPAAHEGGTETSVAVRDHLILLLILLPVLHDRHRVQGSDRARFLLAGGRLGLPAAAGDHDARREAAQERTPSRSQQGRKAKYPHRRRGRSADVHGASPRTEIPADTTADRTPDDKNVAPRKRLGIGRAAAALVVRASTHGEESDRM